uniref:TAP42-like protein n=1 Tax=Chromera velia CCMP2878 TaxID=1169474 RepID=A0A0G4HLR1_9ALVE|mmetsp:Transcript_17239/g.34974  ORF Transcript_17239/g.34974 Transcript_17239/m.34974 type:complete len:354 (-) Transcript_17239:185-1246(-)|eukprot:Cvel_29012.t1-p1 / transcript=Cvel_29012.t1 / gene=Cvel_29012 / organism=Chromera_velia_CCMP2878 / gene_product=Immunoglobulin-binding protein 1, putative / transcript_product=Immunoglobulin-binding protein 1, putative / location=Cvel_scaffold3908:10675-11733(-) / protein_length=353 / sequence_SO=supercontig / SO=protein_coding / is_pseudo=false
MSGEEAEKVGGGQTLSSFFSSCYKDFRSLDSLPHPKRDEKTQELISKLTAIARHTDRAGLFSRNEDLEDVHVSDLKFLLTDFLLGELHFGVSSPEGRLGHIRTALVYWRSFVERLFDYGLVSEADKEALKTESGESEASRDKAKDPMVKRSEKIARFKRSKDLDSKADALFERLRKAGGAGSSSSEDNFEFSLLGIDEEVASDLLKALIERAVITTIERVPMAEQEIQILEMMERQGGPGRAEALEPSPPPRKKPFILRINDPSELRELYKERVFQPHYELPSVSLAEFAEMEMAQLQERERKAAERKREEAIVASFESEAAREEAEEMKARGWDDWKDDNPRGWGNKKGNVG